MPPESAPPPLSELQRLVLHSDYPVGLSFDAACENVRSWLRAEIERRLRELAERDPAALPCRVCGDAVEISRGHAANITRGGREGPLCPSCRAPERAALQDAEVVRFVELLGDSAEELARAVAALS